MPPTLHDSVPRELAVERCSAHPADDTEQYRTGHTSQSPVSVFHKRMVPSACPAAM